MIYLIVKILIKDLFTITSNIEGGVLWKKSSKYTKQNTWIIPEKKLIFY